MQDASGTTSVLMLGMSYNRGIRAHKLSMEALFRLLWQAFLEWLSKQEVGLEDGAKQFLVSKSKECQNTVTKGFFSESWPALQGCVELVMSLLDTFKSESRKKSKVFSFWDDYINIVLVILQLVKAERTGNWKLHLSATAAMVPHFFSINRVTMVGGFLSIFQTWKCWNQTIPKFTKSRLKSVPESLYTKTKTRNKNSFLRRIIYNNNRGFDKIYW